VITRCGCARWAPLYGSVRGWGRFTRCGCAQRAPSSGWSWRRVWSPGAVAHGGLLSVVGVSGRSLTRSGCARRSPIRCRCVRRPPSHQVRLRMAVSNRLLTCRRARVHQVRLRMASSFPVCVGHGSGRFTRCGCAWLYSFRANDESLDAIRLPGFRPREFVAAARRSRGGQDQTFTVRFRSLRRPSDVDIGRCPTRRAGWARARPAAPGAISGTHSHELAARRTCAESRLLLPARPGQHRRASVSDVTGGDRCSSGLSDTSAPIYYPRVVSEGNMRT
jgi:hypothetical protein